MNSKNSKLWTKDFVVIFIENFLAALSFYLLMIVMSGYAMSKFDSSPGEAGFSASIFIIGGLIARLFLGRWIGQIGHKKTLCAGVILSLIMTVLYFGVNSIILLLTIRFFMGWDLVLLLQQRLQSLQILFLWEGRVKVLVISD